MIKAGHGLRSTTLWYVALSAMLCLSLAQALTYHPVFSGKADVLIGAMLAIVAGIQFVQRKSSLEPKPAALSAVFLLTFCIAQVMHFAVSVGPPATARGVDFSAYYLAGKVVAEKPTQSLYELPRFADGRMNLNAETPVSSPWSVAARRYQVPFSAPYIYPPLFAVLMRPLARLPFAWAYAAWNIVTILLAAFSVVLSLKMGGLQLDRRLALILGVGLFSYYPLLDNLFFGQIGGLILFLFTAGVWLLSRNRMGASALCFALATAIKLTPILAVPILVFHRRWKWLMAYGFWMSGLLIFSVWQGGWTAHKVFWHDVLPSISSGAPVCQNLSIMAFVQELFLGYVPLGHSPPSTIPLHAGLVSRLIALSIYLFMLARFYMRRHEGDLVRDLAVMALLGILISPISWTHHYMMAIFPFVYRWAKETRGNNRILLALFLAVGTSVLQIVRIPAPSHILQLVLAAIIPGLTMAVAYQALAPRKHFGLSQVE